jgi:hypothetical protein
MSKNEGKLVVSLNDIAEIVQNYSVGRIDDLLRPLDASSEAAIDCNCRCGCLGVDCSCRGQVGMVSVQQDEWERLKLEKADYARALKDRIRGQG